MSNTIRAASLTGYANLARSLGLDPLRMLDDAGLPREALTEPDLRISAVGVARLYENSSRAAEDFGLRMYDFRTPSTMGPVTLLAREQPTVRAVLETFSRHLSLHSDVTALALEDDGDVTRLRVNQASFKPGQAHHLMLLAMGQLMRILRLPLGPAWRPQLASFVADAPKSTDTYVRVFGPNLAFNQDFDGLVCARSDIDRPNPGADPELARQIGRYIEALPDPTQAGPAERVRELVLTHLASGKCTADWAARMLSTQLRTLQRELAAAQTSFGEIVQAARVELIQRHLDTEDRPLAEVAELLGFSALSAFSRWHKLHFGQSPSARRDALRLADAR